MTRGAGAQVVSPAWSASITQVPTPVKETSAPLIEQTEVAEASMVNVTGRPEVAVAVGV